MNLRIRVTDVSGNILAEKTSQNEVTLVYPKKYKRGTQIELTCENPGFYMVRLEDTLPEAIVYIPNATARFQIPFMMERISYSPRSFKGRNHLIAASVANPSYVGSRRNLAFNPYDQHGDTGMFPHAAANVETRNEALFAARNAIDGIHANHKHYPYPFQSWGINKDPKAELKIDFGTAIDFDEIRLVLRADYPHDNHWTSATLDFSDETSEIIALKKSDLPQSFSVKRNGINWLKLSKLIPSEDPSPFPALTQIEVWGVIQQTHQSSN